jgi:hypothetical protein
MALCLAARYANVPRCAMAPLRVIKKKIVIHTLIMQRPKKCGLNT